MSVRKERAYLSPLCKHCMVYILYIYFHDLPYLHNNQMTMLQTYKLSHVRVLSMGTWQRVLHTLFTPSLSQSFHFFRRRIVSLAF